MTLSYAVLHVSDVDTSLKLHRDVLGLEVERRYPMEGVGEAAWLVEPGEIALERRPVVELVKGEKDSPRDLGEVQLGYEVASLDEKTALMEREGFRAVRTDYVPAPGVRISTFEGPDGELIELMERSR